MVDPDGSGYYSPVLLPSSSNSRALERKRKQLQVDRIERQMLKCPRAFLSLFTRIGSEGEYFRTVYSYEPQSNFAGWKIGFCLTASPATCFDENVSEPERLQKRIAVYVNSMEAMDAH